MSDPYGVLPEEGAAIGPRVGSRFPDCALFNQRGELVDLHVKRAGRRAIVVIFRSADW